MLANLFFPDVLSVLIALSLPLVPLRRWYDRRMLRAKERTVRQIMANHAKWAARQLELLKEEIAQARTILPNRHQKLLTALGEVGPGLLKIMNNSLETLELEIQADFPAAYRNACRLSLHPFYVLRSCVSRAVHDYEEAQVTAPLFISSSQKAITSAWDYLDWLNLLGYGLDAEATLAPVNSRHEQALAYLRTDPEQAAMAAREARNFARHIQADISRLIGIRAGNAQLAGDLLVRLGLLLERMPFLGLDEMGEALDLQLRINAGTSFNGLAAKGVLGAREILDSAAAAVRALEERLRETGEGNGVICRFPN
jgi:hypothetical protein